MPILSPAVSEYLSQFDPRLLASPEGRRILTRLEPKLFAITYLSKHLLRDDVLTFSPMHDEWFDFMQTSIRPVREPREARDAFIAPRGGGKTTFYFLIYPLWLAAHNHTPFVAAFADTSTMAERHLTTFKFELDNNLLLNRDFPRLCEPMKRKRGTTTFDNRGMVQQSNGFIFSAKGIDSNALGMKVGKDRPSVILLDDVESPEANYSLEMAEQRLQLIQEAILDQEQEARVILTGTVTLNGSIVHQLARSVQSTDEPVAPWIGEERFRAHYYPALTYDDQGRPCSVWPERWSPEFLQSIAHTRSFMKNFQNQPMASDSHLWSIEDISYGALEEYPVTILSIDPAVTTKKSSDFTGLAVLGFDPKVSKVYVRDVFKVKLSPKGLKLKAAEILDLYPEITAILCETNQGGDLFAELFQDLPVRYVEKKQSVKKEVRMAWLLDGYQKRRAVHTHPMPELENELLAAPHGLNDDLIDAVGTGYANLTGAGQPRKTKFHAKTVAYA